MNRSLICYALVAMLFFSCASRTHDSKKEFIRVENGRFMKDGKPYYYVGANFWYGAILASEGQGGNRKRLSEELDSLKAIGIDNLRVLVGADGHPAPSKVEPALQVAPGVYNDTILAGLDYLMMELNKRDMYAVLYLNNSWEWSGGYGQYLEWAGYGKAPVPAVDGWPAFMEYVKQYAQADSAKTLFANHVKDIVTRTNRFTGERYVDDSALMAWQIGNEPRAFSDENKEPYAQWMAEIAALIKTLDPNHLVSTGSEGKAGIEDDLNMYERVHKDGNIDYMTIHVWPYNWGWAKEDSLEENEPEAESKTLRYVQEHLRVAQKYGKPLVMEEFGYPRDGMKFVKDVSTTARDNYYRYVFSLIEQSAREKGVFAGCNFWAWGGLAQLLVDHTTWQRWDDYTGDPAQEPQGLNSVFASDASTLSVIQRANDNLRSMSE